MAAASVRQHAARADAAPRQAAALSLKRAVVLLALALQPRRTGRSVESARVAEARDLKDSAIVLLSFYASLRRSEMAALRWQAVLGGQAVTAARWRGQQRVCVRAPRRAARRPPATTTAYAVAALRTATPRPLRTAWSRAVATSAMSNDCQPRPDAPPPTAAAKQPKPTARPQLGVRDLRPEYVFPSGAVKCGARMQRGSAEQRVN